MVRLWQNISVYGMKTNTVSISLKEGDREYWMIINHGFRYRISLLKECLAELNDTLFMSSG